MIAVQHHPPLARRRPAGSVVALTALAAGLAVGQPLGAQLPKPVSSHPIQVATIEADADARVQGGGSATSVNYPTGDLWLGNPDKTVFLHFPLGSLPANATIMSAELQMTFKDSYSDQGSNSIRIGGVQGPWTETGVTYSAQPNVGWSSSSRTVSAPGIVTWDVKPAVEAWLSGSRPNYGVALQGDGPLKNAFSREAGSTADRPKLRIRYVVTS